MLRFPAIVFGVATLALGGCQTLRMNQGRMHAIVIAAQVGEFRQLEGHWPAGVEDLKGANAEWEFPGAEVGEPSAPPASPHRVEMHPAGENLRVEVYDPSGQRTCKLRVMAPTPGEGTVLIPRIIVKTSVFSCPGEGKRIS